MQMTEMTAAPDAPQPLGALDMALDDMITNTSDPRKRRGRRRRVNPMGGRPGSDRPAKARPAGAAPAPVAGRLGGKAAQAKTGSKITVSNLHHKVTRKDMVDLFSQVGRVTDAVLSFDHTGKFRGMATVSFEQAADAMAAMTRFHNVLLDGQPMSIEMVMTAGVAGLLNSGGLASVPRPAGRTPPAGRGRAPGGAPRGRGRGGRSGGPGGRARSGPKSLDQLNAEMDSYMREGNRPEPLTDNLMDFA